MFIVILIIMASVACRSTDAQTILAPSGTCGKVSLISDNTIDLSSYLGCTTSGETSDEDIVVEVATNNLAVWVISFT